jgi:glycosyltransferase involved in cell wall biosynthesis
VLTFSSTPEAVSQGDEAVRAERQMHSCHDTASSISVLIPCHNAERFIAEAVESVLAQSRKPDEIIVTDDGSTDGTAEILASFGDRIRVVRHEGGQNRGQAASLNLAMHQSRGEFLAFLDADDVWHPRKLEKQVGYMIAHLELGLTYTNVTAVDELRRPLYTWTPRDHHESNRPAALLLNCYIAVSTVAVRRHVVRSVGAADESIQAWDHDYWLRVAERFQIAYLPDELVEYRAHGSQISLRRNQWEDARIVLQKATQRYPYSKSTLRKRRAVLAYRLGQCDRRAGKTLAAGLHFAMAGLLDPKRAIETLLGH